MQLDILCLGEPLLEFNQQPDGRYLPGHGGDTSNCAIAAARSGASTAMVTHLGKDAFGDSFMELWEREGVATDLVKRDSSAHTGIYFVSHRPDGHQFSYMRAGSAASRMTPVDIPADAIRKAKVLHVSGISQAISNSAADAVFEAIGVARSNGVLVSYDTNLRTKLWPIARARATIHATMADADIALPGLEDAVQLTGLSEPEAITDFYLRLGAGVVALTLGAKGTLVASKDQRKLIEAFPVEALDATAAGDTFDGAFLAEYVAHGDPFRAARFANAAAALSTMGYGAVAPMPQCDAVERFLQERTE